MRLVRICRAASWSRGWLPSLMMLAALGGPAHGYVRSRTAHGTPLFWPGPCVFVQPDSGGSTDLTLDVVQTTVQKSLQDWNVPTASCASIALMYDAPAPLEAHLDGRNIVKFRSDKWCHPEDKQNHDICYEPADAAITTVFHLDHPGESDDGFIIDADIELNEINFTFAILDLMGNTTMPARMNTMIVDLENTLTHETGHLLGLDHTCKDAATPANEVDENGMPPPPCNDIPAAESDKIRNATMYNFTMGGDIAKRDLSDDDTAAICAAYPLTRSGARATCQRTNLADYAQRGCSIAGRAAPATALGLLVGAALLALAPRRRLTRPRGGRAGRRPRDDTRAP